MAKDYPRSRRVADQVQRELAEIVRLELKDPRVGMITITDVEVTSDYAHAKVYFTLLDGASRADEAVTGLRRAAGFLRSQLARRIKLRTVPQLQFVYDRSVERGIDLSRLIDEAVGGGKPPTPE
jgi:ribosome-binding factor A